MKTETLTYTPSLLGEHVSTRLDLLLAPGVIDDRDLTRRIAALDERFRIYTACSRFALWGPGQASTQEMDVATEKYLPLQEIRAAFHRLFTLAVTYNRFLPPSALDSSASWLEVLHHLQPLAREANPGRLLRHLMTDGAVRSRLLFSLFVPRHFGGGFGRYPLQAEFLRTWLTGRRAQGRVRCLDAACGSGEGTYELAQFLLETGYSPEDIEVRGVTISPLEVFTAAHGWFPHDAVRQAAFRSHIGPIFERGAAERITFDREDLHAGKHSSANRHDIILCNGLLGGPLLNERKKLAGIIAGLCARLRPGGILLAADRFHGGWKRMIPENELRNMLAVNGLSQVSSGEGVAGIKPRP